jgi:Protein of unknown function (DUF3386)
MLMFRIASCAVFGLLFGLAVAVADDQKPTVKSDPEAEKLIKDAHVARASWETASFPGFSCKLVAVLDGKEAVGKLTVAADGKLQIDLPVGPVREWAVPQLESLVSHRFAGDRGRYDVAFADAETKHPMGRLIQFSGTKNFYRIQGNVITEVHRKSGDGTFTISVTDVVRNTEGKYLPRSFNVSYWDGAGNLVRNEDYLEEYTRVGKLDVPTRRLQIRTAKGERVVGELRMSDHQLTNAK